MAKNQKTGGRVAGTPNKRTQEVIDKLIELDCDPIEGMARIAQQAEDEGDKQLAGQMYKELAVYVAPKRKAVEQTIKDERESLDPEQLDIELRNALLKLKDSDPELLASVGLKTVVQ